jgi:digeranylgeranylglycerophospholipid reductase
MAEDALNVAYDVVVIGAGPAGSSAAKAAAQREAKVLLIDRRQRIGVPVQCAEFVPQGTSRHAFFSSKPVLQIVDAMITHLPSGTSYEMKGPGYMIDRSLFDKELVVSALLSGAKISIETKAVGLAPDGVVVEHGTGKTVIKSKVVIGADGVHSTTARSLGLPSLKTIVAQQYEVVNPLSQPHVDVFFHKDYEGGYAWLFPKGRTANVGIGIIPQKISVLSTLMNNFLNFLVDSKKLPSIQIIGKTGGSIPCDNPRKTVFENTLLVGDAAGHAHPITGAGILNAIMGGEIAGRIAAEAVAKGDLRYLEKYESEWREVFGNSLSYGASKRRFLEENWNKPGVAFEDLIRQSWTGFKAYHRDRRQVNAQKV